MIRAHCVELCRQCFIHDVPMLESHRYIRLLIYQLTPFLDWIYSGGTKGRNNFDPNADQELRRIVLEIRSLYRKRSKIRKQVSHRNEDLLEPSIELVEKKVKKELKKTTDPDEKRGLQNLLDLINTEDIMVRDVEKLVDMVQALSRREGNEWHRMLLSDLHHPVSLKQVVFLGDKMLNEPSSILIVAELPVAKHAGKVDLTVFIRREISEKVLWTPVMVIEVKTKTGFNFNLFGMKIKRKREPAVTPAFYAWKCALSEEEWHSIITSEPDQSALDQLEEYKYELLAEYKQIAPHDPDPPSSLWKGMIVLDTDQNPSDVFSAFQFLLEDLTTGLIHQLIRNDTISVTPESLDSGHLDPRVNLLIAPTSGPTGLLNDMPPATSIPEESPFAERAPDDRILTLYIPIDSPTSSGKTAARLSTNWHLIHHIQECIATSPDPTQVLWLDLKGDYGNKELVEKRFGIGRLYQEKKIPKDTHNQLSNTLRDIKFINLSTFITRIFNNKTKALDRLVRHLQFLIPNDAKRKRIVILDGWAELKEMIPKHQQSLLRVLEYQFLETLPPSDIDIIWIDSGVPHTRMNRFYQRKCIRPLRHDSPRRTHLDEVIYNVPTSPWTFGWTTPQQEEARIIIQDIPAKVEPWKVSIHVPQLKGFAEKFRGMSKKKRTYSFEEVERYTTDVLVMHGKSVSLSSIYSSTGRLPKDSHTKLMDEALTLIPSVLRDRGIEREEDEDLEKIEEEEVPAVVKWRTKPHTVSSRYGPALKKRMHIDITKPPPVPVRGKPQYTLAEAITRPWQYKRTPIQFDEDLDEQYVSTAPPIIKGMLGGLIDSLETRELELRRLQYATRYLKDQTYVPKGIRQCCKRIEQHCKKQFSLLKEHPSLNTPEFFLKALKNIRGYILEDSMGTQVWQHLLPTRRKLIDLLNSENREIIEEISRRTPDLILLYGNNLFLAVLAALGKNDLAIAERLWSTIAEWTFYQLGMDIQDDEVRWVYSFQAIHSNLRTRANALSQISLPRRSTTQEQVGAVIWGASKNQYEALLLIPQEEGFLTGFVEGLREKWIPPKWHSSGVKPQRLKEFAQDARTSPDMSPLISTTVLDSQVIWFPLVDEDQDTFWVSFSLEHGKPSGRHNVVPWIKLIETIPLSPPNTIPDIPEEVDTALKKLGRIKQKQVPVTMQVDMNHDLEVYEATIMDDRIIGTLEFTRTNGLVRFLRHNISNSGGYLMNGRLLVWERQDIEYSDGLGFIKPLVYQSRCYPDEFHYPKTSNEHIRSTTGNQVTMTVTQEGSQYRVELGNLPSDSSLKGLEDVPFDIYALGLLTDCEQLYDLLNNVWHPVVLDVTAIMHISFSKIHEYPKLKKAIETADESDFDWTLEEWQFDGNYWSQRGEITWSITLKNTGRTWMNRTHTFILHDESPPEETMDRLRKSISSIAPLDQLKGVVDAFDRFQSVIRDRHQDFLKKKEEAKDFDEDHQGQIFSHTGTEVQTISNAEKVIVSLESDKGEELEIDVIQNVRKLIDDTGYAGSISSEGVRSEVTDSISPYDIDDSLEEIIRAVKEVLEENGVRFQED